uniref:Uncharacterized protein n=1 Tax=Anguilla anguilla TaxID=7936 RepID=A0A0E9RFH5_ANGAN
MDCTVCVYSVCTAALCCVKMCTLTVYTVCPMLHSMSTVRVCSHVY